MANNIIARNGTRIKDGDKTIGVRLIHDPITVGIAGAGGMMGPYHTEDLQHGRISKVTAVYDLEEVARGYAAAYGVRHAFFHEGGDQAFDEFLAKHLLTVISGPNNVHYEQAKTIFGRKDADKRFVYIEKPPANSLEGAEGLAELEKKFPGQIGLVSQNRMWAMELEMKHLIASGAIGKGWRYEGEFRQDWIGPSQAINWRLMLGVGGEDGPTYQGSIGKLLDILFHVVDNMQFVACQPITSIKQAYVNRVIKERPPESAGTYGATSEAAKMVPVGGDSKYYDDDTLTAIVEFKNGAKGTITVGQNMTGEECTYRLTAYGDKGSLKFDAARPNELKSKGYDNKEITISRNPGEMTYRESLPEWLIEGLRMDTPPVQYHTPPSHPKGWRETHKDQTLAFALYAQLVTNRVITKDARSRLYMVPTAAEGLDAMKAIRGIYQHAANTQDLELRIE